MRKNNKTKTGARERKAQSSPDQNLGLPGNDGDAVGTPYEELRRDKGPNIDGHLDAFLVRRLGLLRDLHHQLSRQHHEPRNSNNPRHSKKTRLGGFDHRSEGGGEGITTLGGICGKNGSKLGLEFRRFAALLFARLRDGRRRNGRAPARGIRKIGCHVTRAPDLRGSHVASRPLFIDVSKRWMTTMPLTWTRPLFVDPMKPVKWRGCPYPELNVSCAFCLYLRENGHCPPRIQIQTAWTDNNAPRRGPHVWPIRRKIVLHQNSC